MYIQNFAGNFLHIFVGVGEKGAREKKENREATVKGKQIAP